MAEDSRPLRLRLPRVAVAILVQIVAALATIALIRATGLHFPAWAASGLIGFAAAGLTALAGLERWWIIIQLCFAPLLLAMLRANLPAWLFLAVFCALAVVYWSTFRTRVPLYLSNARTWQAVETIVAAAAGNQPLKFVDLGSGLGGLLCHLSTRLPSLQFEGVELAPLPALLSRLRARLTGRRNLRIRWGSFWKLDLKAYDIVFAFLSPVPMPELWRKARSEMRPGTLFISCAFEVPGVPPQQIVELDSPRQPRLLIWRM